MIDANHPRTCGSPCARSLDAWLSDLERRHPSTIELGLNRVGLVWRLLGSPRPGKRVITVGGTNGKGSVVAFLVAAARANAWRVGAYTSPHIHRYNERFRINDVEASDSEIVRCFEQIDAVRGRTPLTYFEFSTLAGVLLMAEASPALDLAVLEVGLGGRLDAVNIIDPDVAVITTIALDHQEWLGETREAIAREKAGIARSRRPLIIGERAVEPALIAAAGSVGARMFRLGHEFDWCTDDRERFFQFEMTEPVPMPFQLPLIAPCQPDNAATALAALVALAEIDKGRRPDETRVSRRQLAGARAFDLEGVDSVAPVAGPPYFDLAAAAAGLVDAHLPGRLERIAKAPEVIVDVGHNPQAAATLAQWLDAENADTTTDAVFSALADKDIEGIVAPLVSRIRHWYVAGLDHASPRGLSAAQVAARMERFAADDGGSIEIEASGRPCLRMSLHATVTDALSAATAVADPDDRVLVFGSFHVVDEARTSLRRGL